MADPLRPEGKLDLGAANGLYESLAPRIGQNIEIDLGAVTQLGALCLQILLAAAKATKDAGHAFELSNVSSHIAEQIANMGTTPELISEGTA